MQVNILHLKLHFTKSKSAYNHSLLKVTKTFIDLMLMYHSFFSAVTGLVVLAVEKFRKNIKTQRHPWCLRALLQEYKWRNIKEWWREASERRRWSGASWRISPQQRLPRPDGRSRWWSPGTWSRPCRCQDGLGDRSPQDWRNSWSPPAQSLCLNDTPAGRQSPPEDEKRT